MPGLPSLPSLAHQLERLLELDLEARSGVGAAELRSLVDVDATAQARGSLLAAVPTVLPPSMLAPHLEHKGRPGFVVTDMTDVDDFIPIDGAEPPAMPLYVVHGLERGDEMANWSPDEALPAIRGRGRTPLTLTEGLHWVLQSPTVLERNHTFMTIASRITRPGGHLDARTPAIWISNGTGRDGPERRNAPKVGWCWAGNRHTWLGFASAASRTPLA